MLRMRQRLAQRDVNDAKWNVTASAVLAAKGPTNTNDCSVYVRVSTHHKYEVIS